MRQREVGLVIQNERTIGEFSNQSTAFFFAKAICSFVRAGIVYFFLYLIVVFVFNVLRTKLDENLNFTAAVLKEILSLFSKVFFSNANFLGVKILPFDQIQLVVVLAGHRRNVVGCYKLLLLEILLL